MIIDNDSNIIINGAAAGAWVIGQAMSWINEMIGGYFNF